MSRNHLSVLEKNDAFVDDMSSMLGADVTLFRGDVRIAITLRLNLSPVVFEDQHGRQTVKVFA